jgi:hypothetical protein
MTYHIIYNKADGEILHIHSVYDISKRAYISQKKEDILSALSEFFPDFEKVDIITVKEPMELRGMRVNPKEKKLEKIPTKKERD